MSNTSPAGRGAQPGICARSARYQSHENCVHGLYIESNQSIKIFLKVLYVRELSYISIKNSIFTINVYSK